MVAKQLQTVIDVINCVVLPQSSHYHAADRTLFVNTNRTAHIFWIQVDYAVANHKQCLFNLSNMGQEIIFHFVEQNKENVTCAQFS